MPPFVTERFHVAVSQPISQHRCGVKGSGSQRTYLTLVLKSLIPFLLHHHYRFMEKGNRKKIRPME